LSIVSTMFRSAGYLEEFCSRVAEAANQFKGAWELILVNDGSPDDSLNKAISLQKKISQIVVVDLSKNFGHHFAIVAGLSEARGDHVFLIDCDLEESPEWLTVFQSKMKEKDADVVFGQQVTRKGKWFEGISGKLFYSLFNFLSNSKMPESWVTARLMTRQYVDAVLNYGERALFLGGTFTLAGFNQVPVLIKKGSRETSTYSLRKRFMLFVNAVTSFSPQPLYFIFAIGLTVTFISFLGFLFVLVRALFGYTLIGWASLISSIWLFGGLTIFSIGLVGVYVGKILIESKQRPLYHIKKIYTAESKT
jgi:putative glycosyltransferase